MKGWYLISVSLQLGSKKDVEVIRKRNNADGSTFSVDASVFIVCW